jgi:hypothetical protein
MPPAALAFLVFAFALVRPPPGHALETAVDTDANIVTALDVSDSIMRHEEWIELDGLIRAVVHPAFLAAVRAGRHGRIGFAAIAWSSHGDFRVIIPWTVLGSAAEAERIAHALRRMPRRGDAAYGGDHGGAGLPSPDRMTDISGAIRFGQELLTVAPFRTKRPVLNVCGDGFDNVGEGPEGARDLAVGAGITINGLAIGPEPGVAAYYRDRVIGGPGSFVVEAREPTAFVEAMLKKLLLELLATRRGGAARG